MVGWTQDCPQLTVVDLWHGILRKPLGAGSVDLVIGSMAAWLSKLRLDVW